MSNDQPAGGAPGREEPPIPQPNLFSGLTESFGISRVGSLGLLIFIGFLLAGAAFFFIYSAPPNVITITSGPEGSIFFTNAWRYSTNLAAQGVKLKNLPSQGSLENLKRLENPGGRVEVGFVQAGLTTNAATGGLVTLGSIGYQPLLVFYRGAPADTLAGLAGRRLAIGPVGSGTRTLVLTLLAANGIRPGEATTLLDWESPVAAQALLDGTVDAVFLMGEDASAVVMRKLLLAPGIQLMNFAQAEAYTRRFSYLSLLTIPQGAIDFGKNIPSHDVNLIGPTVELVARRTLHPALSDLLLKAAQEVHGKAGLFQHKGEFPARLTDEFPLSDDAARFYKSGRSFFYQHLPFWLASLASRIVVVFVPMIVILIPVVRSVPHLYRWRNQTRIYRWYRALLRLEKALGREPDAARRQHLLQRLDDLEKEVNKMKVPAFLADQFYGLRGHIALVRELPGAKPTP